MRVTDHRTVVRREEVIRFDGGEERPVPYSRSARRYRADVLRLTWITSDTDAAWALSRVQIGGRVLKSDGSDSKNRVDETLWSTDLYPTWVREMVDSTDPTAA